MELYFPQGDLDKPMCHEQQKEFFQKMKNVVWAIKGNTGKDDFFGIGFCIDPIGLLLTDAHTFEANGPIHVSARRDQDDNFLKCEIVFLLKHFNLALVRVVGKHASSSICELEKEKKKNIIDENFNGFDYVPINGAISRHLPFGIEVFTIVLDKMQGFHLLRGMLAYQLNDDDTDYLYLAKETDYKVEICIEDHNFFNATPYRVVKGSLASDRGLHPELKYLQMQFIGIKTFGTLSGAPVFNSQGRVIGIIQTVKHSVKGVTSSALEAFVKCYKEILA